MIDTEKVDWYVFEESYLSAVDYNLCQRILKIKMDARKSITNPRVRGVENFEDYFEEIEMVFKGVNYYRGAVNENILDRSDNDLGDIYHLEITDNFSNEDGILLKQRNNSVEMILLSNGKEISDNYTNEKNLRCLEFVSEKISFRLAFSNFEIQLSDEKN